MKYRINQAVVIGSGTMGAAIAAHLANAHIAVTLLDIVPDKLTPGEEAQGLSLNDDHVRNRIVSQGFERALKSRPASFFTPETAELVSLGNLEDDFDAISKTDWVIEVIIENLEIKRQLMARIDSVRGPHTIVSTNTSGIPVASIAKGRSAGFREHFLGTHFFNPPRYLKLLELIPTSDTLPQVTEFITHFAEFRLGKGVVLCKDTPNFIANRLFSVSGSFTLDYVLEHAYSVKEVDAITGPPLGRPKTGTFRLLDLVGLDVMEHVSGNLARAIPEDGEAQRYLGSEALNQLVHSMVDQGLLGTKNQQGFYKTIRENGKKSFWELNLRSLEYEPPTKPRFDSIGQIKDLETVGEKLKVLMDADDRAALLAQAVTYQLLSYASHVIPEIADTPKPIDDAMRWGFAHEAGPFEIWDCLGVATTAAKMAQAGFPVATWVDRMLQDGFEQFYTEEGQRKTGVYNPELGDYEAIERQPIRIKLKEQKTDGRTVKQNPGATLVDLGEGVACVELHTKVNALDDDIFNMIEFGLDQLDEGSFEGLVIGTDADIFSAGANLFGVVVAAQQGMWDQLETDVKRFQDMNMRIRYCANPVVVAPAGNALAGGAEIMLHASRIVASAELYTGLIELGAGVIPAGGGTKEMLRRILNPAMRTLNADNLPFLQRIFEQVGMGKVSTSAMEARQMGILGHQDRIVMNRDHLLAEAKREVLHMVAAGYRPPIPEKIYAAGRDALAALRVAIYLYLEGKYISAYDGHLAEKLAYVMTGGDISLPAWVDEQYILSLEREAFLSLVGEEKTQHRMWHILQKGKPLRN